MVKKIGKLINLFLAFGLSMISISFLLTDKFFSFKGIGALIVLIAEAFYFFDVTFKKW